MRQEHTISIPRNERSSGRLLLITGLIVCAATTGWGQVFTFAKIADTNTDIPGGTGKFFGFYDANYQEGTVAFGGLNNLFSPIGLFGFRTNSLFLVADERTSPPDTAQWKPSTTGSFCWQQHSLRPDGRRS